ncbi:hypothetical protein [Zoogloea sp. LCSB751]|uniref:hypothetical protein n=1 Tax=Zoogloea sp. LCSB751 TaxID=1965277 RepID=UPI0009A54027|nr:hypothetical protein [Zoogloea sp. LCSB751]
MVKLSPEKQAEIDKIFSKIYVGLPPEAQAKINQIRAEGIQEIEDGKIEFEARIKQLKSGHFRLVPIAELAWNAAFAARKAEPLESRKDLSACESGRAFIRAIKAALLDGSLVAREQGSGIPVNDRSWCLENDDITSLPAMMPHDRLMVRTDEVKAWLEKMGIATDAFPLLNLAAEGLSLTQQAPTKAEPEEPVGEESGAAHARQAEESPEERGERIYRRSQELGGTRKKGVTRALAQEEAVRNGKPCSESNIKRILADHERRQAGKTTI